MNIRKPESFHVPVSLDKGEVVLGSLFKRQRGNKMVLTTVMIIIIIHYRVSL